LGDWRLSGGAIVGGTITSSGGAKLTLTNSGGTFSGVTIAAGLTVDTLQSFSSAGVTGGLTLNGTLNVGNTAGSTSGQLFFQGTQTLSGTGTVVFGGSGNNVIYAQGNNGASPATLTIGSGINIQGGVGSIRGYYISGSNDSIVNQGTINM